MTSSADIFQASVSVGALYSQIAFEVDVKNDEVLLSIEFCPIRLISLAFKNTGH